jgi:hypothetical protein
MTHATTSATTYLQASDLYNLDMGSTTSNGWLNMLSSLAEPEKASHLVDISTSFAPMSPLMNKLSPLMNEMLGERTWSKLSNSATTIEQLRDAFKVAIVMQQTCLLGEKKSKATHHLNDKPQPQRSKFSLQCFSTKTTHPKPFKDKLQAIDPNLNYSMKCFDPEIIFSQLVKENTDIEECFVYACTNGLANIAKKIASKTALMEFKNETFYQCIMAAIHEGNDEILTLLAAALETYDLTEHFNAGFIRDLIYICSDISDDKLLKLLEWIFQTELKKKIPIDAFNYAYDIFAFDNNQIGVALLEKHKKEICMNQNNLKTEKEC